MSHSRGCQLIQKAEITLCIWLEKYRKTESMFKYQEVAPIKNLVLGLFFIIRWHWKVFLLDGLSSFQVNTDPSIPDHLPDLVTKHLL